MASKSLRRGLGPLLLFELELLELLGLEEALRCDPFGGNEGSEGGIVIVVGMAEVVAYEDCCIGGNVTGGGGGTYLGGGLAPC